MSTQMESLTDIVQRYYECIDASDSNSEWALQILDTTQPHPHQAFVTVRRISGTHVLEQVWQTETNVVMAFGEFDAREAASGECRCVRFVEIWRFGADRRIERRQMFLSLGARCVHT